MFLLTPSSNGHVLCNYRRLRWCITDVSLSSCNCTYAFDDRYFIQFKNYLIEERTEILN